jgi:hypothetical protein
MVKVFVQKYSEGPNTARYFRAQVMTRAGTDNTAWLYTPSMFNFEKCG